MSSKQLTIPSIIIILLCGALGLPAHSATIYSSATATKVRPVEKPNNKRKATKSTNATTKKGSKAPSKSKSKSGTKAASNAKTKTAAETARKSRGTFEGDLYYTTHEFYNKVLRTFSQGTIYNGIHRQKVTLKGNQMHVHDLTSEIHTLILPAKNVVYYYSELTSTGFEMSLDSLRKTDILGDAKSINGFDRTHNATTVLEGLEFRGDKCNAVNVSTSLGDFQHNRAQVWIADNYRVPDVYSHFIMGYKGAGLIKKYLIASNQVLPFLLGQGKTLISGSLTKIEPRCVAASEMTPPSTIFFIHENSIGAIQKLRKKTNDVLKKRKMLPETMSGSDVKKKITTQWNFAETWHDEKIKSKTMDGLTQTIFTAIGEIFSTPAKIVKDIKSSNTENQVPELEIETTPSQKVTEEVYYIPELAQSIRMKTAPLKDQLNENERIKERNRRCARHKYTRIGSSYIKITDASTVVPTMGEIKESSAKSTIEYFEKQAQAVENYGLLHHTDYISKSDYEAIRDRHEKFDKKRHKREKEYRKMRSDIFRKKIYDDYEDLLYYHSCGNERDLDWIKNTQDLMKDLRGTCGAKKSQWEDWDGINDPW